MSSSGFADARILGETFLKGFHQGTPDASIYDPRDLLFKVVSKLNYGAAKDLKKQKKLHPEGLAPAVLADLQKKVMVERQYNEDMALSDVSRTVTYGMRIQLLHTKSSKFLTVQKSYAAELEKQCRRVELIEHGDKSCIFKVMPVFKHKTVGEPVNQGDHVIKKQPNDVVIFLSITKYFLVF